MSKETSTSKPVGSSEAPTDRQVTDVSIRRSASAIEARKSIYLLALLGLYFESLLNRTAAADPAKTLRAFQLAFNAFRSVVTLPSAPSALTVDGAFGRNTARAMLGVLSLFVNDWTETTASAVNQLANRNVVDPAQYARIVQPELLALVNDSPLGRDAKAQVFWRSALSMLLSGRSAEDVVLDATIRAESTTTGWTADTAPASAPEVQRARAQVQTAAQMTQREDNTYTFEDFEIRSSGKFSWAKVWPFVFLGVAVLGGGAWFYWNRKPGRKGLFGASRSKKRHKAPRLFNPGR